MKKRSNVQSLVSALDVHTLTVLQNMTAGGSNVFRLHLEGVCGADDAAAECTLVSRPRELCRVSAVSAFPRVVFLCRPSVIEWRRHAITAMPHEFSLDTCEVIKGSGTRLEGGGQGHRGEEPLHRNTFRESGAGWSSAV